MNGLGLFLRTARLKKGLSMMSVCEETGITNSRLSRIENGLCKHAPPIDDVISLLVLYDIDFGEILSFFQIDAINSLSHHTPTLKNIDQLDAKELRHIQDEINFIISQKVGRNNEI